VLNLKASINADTTGGRPMRLVTGLTDKLR